MVVKHKVEIENDPRQNEIKICSICGEHKQRKEYYISNVKSNGTVVRKSACNTCEIQRQSDIRKNNGIYSKLVKTKEINGSTHYECNVCNEYKPKNAFPKDSDPRNILGFRRPCKICRKHCHKSLRTSDVEWFLSDQQIEDRDKHYGSLDRIKQVLLNLARERSRRNGIECTITVNDFDIPKVCPLIGIKIIPGIGSQSPNSPSLDRIDQTKGYVKNNICIISYRANAMKNDANVEELTAFANNILNYIEMKR